MNSLFSLHIVLQVAQREFVQKIRKKAFWIVSLISPLLIALLMIVPVWITMDSSGNKLLLINGFNADFVSSMPKIPGVQIKWMEPNQSGDLLQKEGADYELRKNNLGEIEFYYVTQNVLLEEFLKERVSNASGGFIIKDVKWESHLVLEENNGRGVRELMAYMLAITVYIFIFMHGVQIMKGVIEEKNNRIIEVLLCTVKPFELMLGKIMGMSWVALVQFLIWGFLVVGLQLLISEEMQFEAFTAENILSMRQSPNQGAAVEVYAFMKVLAEINWLKLLFSFLFYFYVGFLAYGACFAIIGAASDADSDVQQFMFPLTLPLIGTFTVATKIISSPSGMLSEVLSYIPLTSPIAMPLRLPFDGDEVFLGSELLVSVLILFLFMVSMTWVASRIYRVGVLSYGQKTNFGTLIKWFFQKEY